jgi:transcriptional regulator MraZ
VEGLLPLLHLGPVKLSESHVAPFRGTFDHTLDAKNRLTVPARYRSLLAEGVVLATPVDLLPCVGVWRAEDYEAYTRRALEGQPAISARRAELARFLYGGSHDVDLDAAGRIMIPSSLREAAGLAKDVKVVGAGERLELWDATGWNGHLQALQSSIAEVTARADDAD